MKNYEVLAATIVLCLSAASFMLGVYERQPVAPVCACVAGDRCICGGNCQCPAYKPRSTIDAE